VNIRWRLAALAVQLIILTVGVYIVEGSIVAGDVWYASGMLAIVINPALLEPYYPRPGDVVGNAAIGLLLVLLAPKETVPELWAAATMLFLAALAIGLLALLFGAGRTQGRFVTIGRAARLLSHAGSARTLYSVVFWLAVLEQFSVSSVDFLVLAVVWTLIMLAGSVNWQRWWGFATAGSAPARIEDLLGPSVIRVTAPDLPKQGEPVVLRSDEESFPGVVVKRIRRVSDSWGELHVSSQSEAERLLALGEVRIEAGNPGEGAVGSVGEGSTHRLIRFTAAQPLEIGRAISVHSGDQELVYQLAAAELRESKVRGGSHLVVEATAEQVGWFDPATMRLIEHRWTPDPGSPILGHVGEPDGAAAEVPAGKILLGWVIGTRIPVFMDVAALCEAHMTILGMTKMGKTSLALRLARRLGSTRRVVVLDQTGEHVSKRGLPTHTAQASWLDRGVFVHESAAGAVGADFALAFLDGVVEQAIDEYRNGEPTPRSVFIDEAHQFVPEPAGLGFNAPGRDSSYRIGTLMMQVRKYGLSVVLISQRTAVVAKSALSQCENLIAFRSVDQTGLDYLEQIGGPSVRNLLPSLRQGEALVMGPAISSDRPVAIEVAEDGEA
jgi:hypothetical protein